MFHNIVLVEEIRIILYRRLPKHLLILLILCQLKTPIFNNVNIPVGHCNILIDIPSFAGHLNTNVLCSNLSPVPFVIVGLYGIFVFVSSL